MKSLFRNKYFWLVLGVFIIFLDILFGKGLVAGSELGSILPNSIGTIMMVVIFGTFLWFAARWTKVPDVSFSITFGIGTVIKIVTPYIDTFLLSKIITPSIFGTSAELNFIYIGMIMTSLIFTTLLVKYLFNTTWAKSLLVWLIASSITLAITYILIYISIFTGFRFFIPGSQVLFPM